MNDHKVSVVIPVGPFLANKRWLREAIDSVVNQTYPVDELLVIDDMARLTAEEVITENNITHIWQSPWRLGVAHAFNFGVALAMNELVFMLGSDDWLEPDCIEKCVREYDRAEYPENSYFFVGVRYSDDREDKEQFTPCAAAMVTKSLWKHTGGLPIEASTGASDSAFCSIFWSKSEICRFVGVAEGKSLYNYRVHDESDTAKVASWQGIILETRNLVTSQWNPPFWTNND